MNYDDGLIRGITASSFDLLHAGHILMLREAKSVCDYLICALQTDPTIDRPEKNKPIQSYMERHIQLSAVKYVDEIIPYATEEEWLALLNNLPVHIRIIGEDYRGKDFKVVEKHFLMNEDVFCNQVMQKEIMRQNPKFPIYFDRTKEGYIGYALRMINIEWPEDVI